jgi:hypothetical protein
LDDEPWLDGFEPDVLEPDVLEPDEGVVELLVAPPEVGTFVSAGTRSEG